MTTIDQNKTMLLEVAVANANRSFNAWNIRTQKAERPQGIINNAAKSECTFARKQFNSECNAAQIKAAYDAELIRLGMPNEIVQYAQTRSEVWQ